MFALTHPAFGLGDRARTGLLTAFGLGAQPVPVPVPVLVSPERPFSPDFVHLALDIRMKQYCKETHTTLATRQTAADTQLATLESTLASAAVSLRQAEHDLRLMLAQRRLEP